MDNVISLLCGYPPPCDRCGGDTSAKVVVNLPTFGERLLCEKCLVLILERGIDLVESVLVDSSGNEIGEDTPEEKARWAEILNAHEQEMKARSQCEHA